MRESGGSSATPRCLLAWSLARQELSLRQLHQLSPSGVESVVRHGGPPDLESAPREPRGPGCFPEARGGLAAAQERPALAAKAPPVPQDRPFRRARTKPILRSSWFPTGTVGGCHSALLMSMVATSGAVDPTARKQLGTTHGDTPGCYDFAPRRASESRAASTSPTRPRATTLIPGLTPSRTTTRPATEGPVETHRTL